MGAEPEGFLGGEALEVGLTGVSGQAAGGLWRKRAANFISSWDWWVVAEFRRQRQTSRSNVPFASI